MTNTFFPNRLKDGVTHVVTKTADYTATTDDSVILCDTTAAAITVTLPAAANSANKRLTILKIDSVANNVTIDGNGSETIAGTLVYLLTRQYSLVDIVCDGVGWQVIGPVSALHERLLARATVDLTANATTTLFTVPSGSTAHITNVWLEGGTIPSGGTSTVLKVGNTSAYSLLNGSSGYTFASGTATSLLAALARVEASHLYNLADADVGKASLFPVKSFAGAKTIGYNTSGTNVTAGTVILELYGYFT